MKPIEFNKEEFVSRFKYVAPGDIAVDAAEFSFGGDFVNRSPKEKIAYLLATEIVDTLNYIENYSEEIEALEKKLRSMKDGLAYAKDYLKELEARYEKERSIL